MSSVKIEVTGGAMIEPLAYFRLELAKINFLNICSNCHIRRATWMYAPGDEIACDKCVPRGCTCNQEPIDGDYENLSPENWKEATDEQGRKYPCCEWLPK